MAHRPPMVEPISQRVTIGRLFEPTGYFAYVPPPGSSLSNIVEGPHGGVKVFRNRQGEIIGEVEPIELSTEEGELVKHRRNQALALISSPKEKTTQTDPAPTALSEIPNKS